MTDQAQDSKVASVGKRALSTVDHIGDLWLLLMDASGWLLGGIAGKRVRLGGDAMIAQMIRVGVKSVFIVSLVSGAIGFILAYQMAPVLDELGQKELIPNILAVAVFRELGPLIAAIVLTGFAGAAIAAEIGTMVVNEEIEALEAHALNPIRFLVVPRLVAATISLICLAVLSNYAAILSAAVMSKVQLGIPWHAYYQNTVAQVGLIDVLTGLFKAGAFGLLIGLIACGNGLRVSGGAEGVGNATTSTVVQSVVAVVIADLLFTVGFYQLGWF